MGQDGTVVHRGLDGWRSVDSSTTNTLYGIWSWGAYQQWAVGHHGTIIYKYDVADWVTEDSRTEHSLWGIWGANARELWVAGDQGTILFSAGGTSWEPVDSGTTASLRGVWGSGSSDIWFVGDRGTTLHHDGAVLKSFDTGTDVQLLSVSGSDANNVWAVGEKGTILHWNGTGWRSEQRHESAGTPTRASLRQMLDMVLRTDADLMAFCSDYFEPTYRRFSQSMDRLAKINLLLDMNSVDEILLYLVRHDSVRFGKYESYLKYKDTSAA